MSDPLEPEATEHQPGTCPECGAAHESDQEYCLECGARLPSPWGERRASPVWVWGAIGSLALVALVSGIVVAVLASRDDGRAAPAISAVPPPAPPASGPVPAAPASVAETAAPPPSTDPFPLPPLTTDVETITIGPLTDTGITTEPPPSETDAGPLGPDTTGFPTDTDPFPDTFTDTDPVLPTEPPPAVGVLTEWPFGSTGYTIVIASIPVEQGRSFAESQAQAALSAGLPEVGILESGSFASLRPGFYVVFSGVYDTLDEATSSLAQARSSGYGTAYTRRVRP